MPWHFRRFRAGASLGSFHPESRLLPERLLYRRLRWCARAFRTWQSAPTDASGNCRNLCMVDAPRVVVENDIDGSTDLDSLEAILRKHPDNCNLILDNKRHCRL